MGFIIKLVLLLATVISAYVAYLALVPAPVPKVENEFWGPASLSKKADDTAVRDFKIKIDDKVITDLKSRLKSELDSKRYAPPLDGVGFEYGFNTNFLPKVLNHWATKYDWKQREQLLNKFPHFKTQIGGIDIHFQRIKSKKNYKKTLPVLLLHGWPGSIVEFQKIIPLLTDPEKSDYNYEVITPSLPGYGFSEAAHRPGMDTVAMANIFLRLMKRLGHEKFYIMGGDWGAIIVSDMAALYPENVLGSHSTMCSSMHPLGTARLMLTSLFPSYLAEPVIADKMFPLSKFFSFLLRETGYFHLQATKPDTVGVALSQSPSGLAAYILEKFSTWTDASKIDREDGGLLEKFTLDELLDNLMLYWVTNSVTSSMRLYSEFATANKKHRMDSVPITVPAACLMLPEELALVPEFTLRDKYPNLQQFTMGSKGGHFGAFEVPDVVAEDAIKFFNGLQKSSPPKAK